MDFFKRHAAWVFLFALAMLLAGSYQALFSAPADFPVGSIVVVARGSSAPHIAQTLADAHVIKHPSVLRLIFRLTSTSGSVQSGAYRFETPQDALLVAWRLAHGDYGFPPVRITFTEGTTVREAAEQVAEAFLDISVNEFTKEAQPYEGYLFPDTYLFSPSADATAIVAAMRENFDAKITGLADAIQASGRSLADTVILASLIEKEARLPATKRMVAGILVNRLELGMPLQVDAVFGYIFNRDTYSPTYADLKVDSPYNTYTHTGLPPGPIANPGLDSLEAAANPTTTDYLYYLTGNDGLMHYATTFAGHQANQRKYLK